MTIYFIVSPMGAGKTLTMTMYGYHEHLLGKTVYSNYPVNFPHIPIRSPIEMADIQEGVFLGDELWSWLDSRESGSTQNKAISRILLKSRKKGYDIYHTAQFHMQPDRRLRNHTDIVIIPEFNKRSQTCIVRRYRYVGKMNVGDLMSEFKFDARPYYALYDTRGGIYSDDEDDLILQ